MESSARKSLLEWQEAGAAAQRSTWNGYFAAAGGAAIEVKVCLQARTLGDMAICQEGVIGGLGTNPQATFFAGGASSRGSY